MKVALVTHWLSKSGGGVSAVVEDLSAALGACGVRAEVFGLKDDRWEKDCLMWKGSAAHVFPVVGPKAFGFSPKLRSAIRGYDADVLHLHGQWLHTSADITACALGNKPVLVSPHGMLDPWAVERSSTKKRIVRFLYEDRLLSFARCMHALNQAEVKSIRAFGLNSPVCLIPNGVSVPKIKEKPTAPWKNIFDSRARILLYLGRLHEKKNIKGLIKAIHRIKQMGGLGNWKLVIAGWDQDGHKQTLANEVARSGLAGDILFLGPVFNAEKEAVLCNASAFVLPSFSEGLPMAVLEAWSYALPVAMSAECNLPEGFDALAAFEVDTAPDKLALDLLEFLSIPEYKHEEMGNRGRNLVMENYSWNAIAREFVNVYRWLLEENSKPKSVQLQDRP